MKDFPDLFAEFANAKSSWVRSKTLRGYTDVTGHYWNWIGQQPQLLDWTHVATVENYLANRRRDGLADASLATVRRTLSVFFNWLVKRQYLDTNPVALTDKPIIRRKLKTYITPGEFAQFLSSIPSYSWMDLRDRCLLLILFFSGLRAGEAVRLCLNDVDNEQLAITVRNGKGGHDRMVPCTPDLPASLSAYLKARPSWSKPIIFVSNNGFGGIRGPITADGVRQMLKRRFAAAHMEYHNIKAFRHSFGTNFLNAGVRRSSLAEMMGHTDEKITAIYAQHEHRALIREYRLAYEQLK
ncbi:MAG: tyrosine-type recombinase/integrase [Caldilineaceae bacterium]|nr:tyrosine-type recombinase/integrase [Caldilineaceae bacterium]